MVIISTEGNIFSNCPDIFQNSATEIHLERDLCPHMATTHSDIESRSKLGHTHHLLGKRHSDWTLEQSWERLVW